MLAVEIEQAVSHNLDHLSPSAGKRVKGFLITVQMPGMCQNRCSIVDLHLHLHMEELLPFIPPVSIK